MKAPAGVAMCLAGNCKNGISSYELHRCLGVTQKTAWFVLQRIRLAMQEGTISKMRGMCEADETSIGEGSLLTQRQGDRRRTCRTQKDAVQGILERTTPSKHSRVVLKKTLVAIIIGLLFFVSSETILAVKRPPYPIKAEKPDAGHWVIISTNEKTR
jgi:hypothetical protein